MEFDFAGTFYVEEDILEIMKKKVKDEQNPYEVIEDWAQELDDADYYLIEYVQDDIVNYITHKE